MTVLAMADNATIRDVIDTARQYNRKVLVDLISVNDIEKRASEICDLGADFICVHTATDVQKMNRTPLGDLTRLVSAIPSAKAAAAGGISLQTVDSYVALRPGIIIAGSSLTKAPDIRKAVIDMKARLIQQ